MEGWKKKKPSSRAKVRKSRFVLVSYHFAPGSLIDYASLGKKKFVVPQTKKVEAPKKTSSVTLAPVVCEKTPRASMKKERAKEKPKQAGDAGVPMWLDAIGGRWAVLVGTRLLFVVVVAAL